MNTRLKELLEKRRRARSGETPAPSTPIINLQTDTHTEKPAFVIAGFDYIEDEFSEYF